MGLTIASTFLCFMAHILRRFGFHGKCNYRVTICNCEFSITRGIITEMTAPNKEIHVMKTFVRTLVSVLFVASGASAAAAEAEAQSDDKPAATISGKTFRAQRSIDKRAEEIAPSMFPIPPNWKTFLTRENALPKSNGHVQGMCVTHDAMYMTLHTGVYKFDWKGHLLKTVPADRHTGDICHWKGRLYTAVCLPGIQPDGLRGRIDVFDEELNLVKQAKFKLPADGITCLGGVLYVGLGPVQDPKAPFRGNWFGKFDAETLEPLCEPFVVDHGYDVCAGVQNIATDGEKLYINFYTPEEGTPCFFVFDLDFKVLGSHVFGWRHGFDLVGGAKDGAVRFVWLETVGWMSSEAYPQALVNYAELKDGRIGDISQHIIFRKENPR
ncbi:MAG TPA: hypothetical protein PLE80_05780 [Opitutaceae bacterium]|nr:hypothetical protein [Opitutaceae bacterium]